MGVDATCEQLAHTCDQPGLVPDGRDQPGVSPCEAQFYVHMKKGPDQRAVDELEVMYTELHKSPSYPEVSFHISFNVGTKRLPHAAPSLDSSMSKMSALLRASSQHFTQGTAKPGMTTQRGV
jgi:hypothetical protein